MVLVRPSQPGVIDNGGSQKGQRFLSGAVRPERIEVTADLPEPAYANNTGNVYLRNRRTRRGLRQPRLCAQSRPASVQQAGTSRQQPSWHHRFQVTTVFDVSKSEEAEHDNYKDDAVGRRPLPH